MTTTVSGSQITFNDNTTQNTSAYGGGFAMRNRIINGDMRIDQRNAGASVTPSGDTYTVDRWKYEASQGSKFTIQQNRGSVTPPADFTNYLGYLTASAVSVGTTDFFLHEQYIEGFNTADLNWGTANAKTVTLSFWVRSSLTGTFGGNLQNNANNRFYPFSYTISSANTWEQKSITIAGDTTGTWLTNNGTGILLRFSLGTGSTYLGTAGSWGSTVYLGVTGQTNVVGTLNATWNITGVQLEKGSTATSFDYRPYGQELALCQRYYYLHASNTQLIGIGYNYSASIATAICHFPVTMRTTPVLSATSGTNFYSFARNGASDTFNSFGLGAASPTSASMDNASEISGTAGQSGQMVCNNASASIAFSAEL